MFWADRIADDIALHFKEKIASGKPLLIRDEKTASGRVHVGSMRGVAIHGTLSRVLWERGIANEFRYELNNFDPFDGLPAYLPKEVYEPYMGVQLFAIPSPEPGADNYADFYGSEFSNVIEESGYHPNFYSSSELYLSGKMDEAIRLALLGADRIREIYKEVSGAVKPAGWLPISVVCENCSKVSTTLASDFDGETIAYVCSENAVTWARGCGHRGRVAPWGGKAKFPWKIEWPAKWFTLGVDIEGGGKDHTTRGGARDVANHIARDIFHIEPPFDVPYEFFLVGGKKMSSSKGQGSSAKEVASLVPAKIFRLALIGKDINQAFNFDPSGETIPTLYDLYDRIANLYASGVKDDFSRLFELVEEKTEKIEVPFLMRFSQIAFLVQMPHLDLYEAAAELKGSSLTDIDRIELGERAAYAKEWLTAHAPEKYRFALQDTLPSGTSDLSSEQKKVLTRVAELLETSLPPEELHNKIHSLKDEIALSPQELFGAIYFIFFGKKEGPKVGWFLSTLDKDFALKRLREAAGS